MTNQSEQRYRKGLGYTYRLFYNEPVIVDRADGVWIIDTKGRKLLDAYNNVPVIGHSHPRVRDAVAAELGRINTHTRYVDARVNDYAEKLLDRFPERLGSIVFTCSGSEANDLAIQVARHVTGRRGVIVTTNAYHGTTAALHDISPSLAGGELNDPCAEIVEPATTDGYSTSQHFTQQVRSAIDRLAERHVEPAAIILDSSLTSDGVITDPQGFLAEGVQLARSKGALYVADEVQAGFCRLGHWWGFERHGLEPDLLTLGKPMGNGMAIAALVARKDLLDLFGSKYRYFNTFAGTPAPIAAASVVLDELLTMTAVERTSGLGQRLRKGLKSAAAGAGVPAEVRGSGLMAGLDLAPIAQGPGNAKLLATQVVDRMRQSGILVGSTGVNSEVVKIRPPLVIEEGEVDLIVNQMAVALSALQV